MSEIELPETPETPESHKERTVGLIIACIAVVLAIVSHLGNEIHQDELLAHIDSSDEYGDYQAKKLTNVQLDLNSDLILLGLDHLSPAGRQQAAQKLAAYADLKSQNEDKGGQHKDEGDRHVAEAARLAKKSSVLDIGEIGLQISIVLCSITILTEQSLFVRLGIVIALAGAAIAAWALFITS